MADADPGNEFDLEGTLAAAKEAGVTLMTQEAFDKRFAKEREKQEGLAAKFDALQAQHQEDSKELQAFRDKGKSEAQREAEATLKLQKQVEAHKAQAAQTAAEKKQLEQKYINERIGNKLNGIFGSRAANPKRAVRAARDELKGLGLGEDGLLTITDPSTEIEYTGDDAVKHINEWIEHPDQSDLLRSSKPGPPAGNPKPGGEHKTPYADLTDEQRFARRHGANV
jgi:hypothetical protein